VWLFLWVYVCRCVEASFAVLQLAKLSVRRYGLLKFVPVVSATICSFFEHLHPISTINDLKQKSLKHKQNRNSNNDLIMENDFPDINPMGFPVSNDSTQQQPT
jgi:hypothetical protein